MTREKTLECFQTILGSLDGLKLNHNTYKSHLEYGFSKYLVGEALICLHLAKLIMDREVKSKKTQRFDLSYMLFIHTIFQLI